MDTININGDVINPLELERLINHLKSVASMESIEDYEDFSLEDCYSGNDYDNGKESGKIEMARVALSLIGVKWK